MALRIYAIGLVQFVIVAVVMDVEHRAREAERRAELEQHRPTRWEAHGKFVAEGLARVMDDRSALTTEAHRAANAFLWTVDVKDSDDHVLVHAEPDERSGYPVDGGSPTRVPIAMRDGRTGALEYLPHLRGPRAPGGRGGFPPPSALGEPGRGKWGQSPAPFGPPPTPPFGLAAVVVLIVVGVSSWLTARSFARPLATLTTATRSFGRGELDARARMNRGDEIGEVANAFDDMADRIGKLLMAERELLANVSHELRTPLARIRVALDLASEADSRSAVDLAEIAEDLAELERIVDDVLASARLALDSGPKSGGGATLPVRAERVETWPLLERSVARFRSAHPDRPIHVEVSDELRPVSADPILLRRVIDNLLDNAHKYTEVSGVPIWLRARNENSGIVIEVMDEGIGIAPEDQSRLFEPFFRVDRSRTRKTGGLGLGLVLAKRVVEGHGGTLTIESALGRGTRARVRLPADDS